MPKPSPRTLCRHGVGVFTRTRTPPVVEDDWDLACWEEIARFRAYGDAVLYAQGLFKRPLYADGKTPISVAHVRGASMTRVHPPANQNQDKRAVLELDEVSIDDGETWIPAYTMPGDLWNGWANPYFSAEQLPALVEHWNNYNTKCNVSQESGTWLESSDDVPLTMIDYENAEQESGPWTSRSGYWFLGGGFTWISKRVHGERQPQLLQD